MAVQGCQSIHMEGVKTTRYARTRRPFGPPSRSSTYSLLDFAVLRHPQLSLWFSLFGSPCLSLLDISLPCQEYFPTPTPIFTLAFAVLVSPTEMSFRYLLF